MVEDNKGEGMPKSFKEKYLSRKAIGTSLVVLCASVGAAVLVKQGIKSGQKWMQSCSEGQSATPMAEATAFMNL